MTIANTIQAPHGTCDAWNDGTYTGVMFGPTVRGNGVAVYTAPIGWSLTTVAAPFRTDINFCSINGVPGCALPLYAVYLISTKARTNGGIELDFTPITQGATRNDPTTGIMCANNAAGQNTFQPVTGMCWRDATYGIQGQGNSEYLIGRHDLWTVQLASNPAGAPLFPGNVIPSDNAWHAFGYPLQFVTWSDRLPMSCAANFVVFNDTYGASLQVALSTNNTPAACPSAMINAVPNTPVSMGVVYPFTGGCSDGFYSVQAYARCDIGTFKIGTAYNSTLAAGIWF